MGAEVIYSYSVTLFKARICFVCFDLLQYSGERPWAMIHCDSCSTNSFGQNAMKTQRREQLLLLGKVQNEFTDEVNCLK